MIRILGFIGLMACPAVAEVTEPPGGSQLRADLLDAVRVVAERDLNAPIEFVVSDLRVDGQVAFALVNAQRPGGAPIRLEGTPLVLRDEKPVNAVDGTRIEAFLIKVNGAWVVLDHATGATDVWWFGYRCDLFASLHPPQSCQ